MLWGLRIRWIPMAESNYKLRSSLIYKNDSSVCLAILVKFYSRSPDKSIGSVVLHVACSSIWIWSMACSRSFSNWLAVSAIILTSPLFGKSLSFLRDGVCGKNFSMLLLIRPLDSVRDWTLLKSYLLSNPSCFPCISTSSGKTVLLSYMQCISCYRTKSLNKIFLSLRGCNTLWNATVRRLRLIIDNRSHFVKRMSSPWFTCVKVRSELPKISTCLKTNSGLYLSRSLIMALKSNLACSTPLRSSFNETFFSPDWIGRASKN